MKFRIILFVLLLGLFHVPPTLSAQDPEDQWWSDQFHLPGLDGKVNCMVEFEGDLILGGAFTHAGKVTVSRIVRWDGASFSSIGSGFDNEVFDLAVHQNILYAKVLVASFTEPAEFAIYRWNGSDWNSLEIVPAGGARLLASCGDSLIVAGRIDSIEGTAVTNISAFDGDSWNTVGSEMDTMVTEVVYHQGKLVAAVNKATEFDNRFNESSIWQLDGTAWTPLGSPFVGRSTIALADHLGELYAVTRDPSVSSPEIVYLLHHWSGSEWTALDEQQLTCRLNNVRDLYSFDGRLFAAGRFFLYDDTSVAAVVEWDGTSFRKTGSEFGNIGTKLTAYKGELIVGGEFIWAGDYGVNHVARYDGSAWNPISQELTGLGIQGEIRSVCAHDSDLVAGGYIFTAGLAAVRGIALFDGTKWSAMGRGCRSYLIGSSGTVADIVYYQGAFVACASEGFFENQQGGRSAIARWTGSDWEALGMSPSSVSALAVYNNELYCVSGNRVYRYEGGNWSTESPVLVGSIYDLVVHDGKLYAAGTLTREFGDVVKLLLCFNGTEWTTIDIPGKPFQVNALGSFNEHLYLGGRWADRAGIDGVRIMMRWNGDKWSAVPEFDGTVGFQMWRLGNFAGKLVALGSFRMADGPDTSNFIAGFDGVSWQRMGSGFDLPTANAMEPYMGGLVVGGKILEAGNKWSHSFAMWMPDHDSDGLFDGNDNCPFRYNPDQADITDDGIGDACCCVGTTGDLNQNQVLDLTDLSILITLLTTELNATPPCPYETYVDGYAGITLSDLSQMVAYFTQSPGPLMPNCP